MAGPGKDYVIGKGRLYFDPFIPGTTRRSGEHYFGNTPELTTTAEAETLDHYDADQGLNLKDESITIENNRSGAFVTDNISIPNVAFFFSGKAERVVQTSATGRSDTFTEVILGRSYQLGTTTLTPTGVRHVNNVVVSKGGSPVSIPGNFEIDLEKGRLYVEPDAPDVASGDTLSVTFDVAASTREVVIGSGDEIRGSLRFISTNPIGSHKDAYWPYVKLTPNGDFALKGSEWQQMGFSFEVLLLPGYAPVYFEGESKLAGQTNSPATGVPTITGQAKVGTALNAGTSAIQDADGLGTFTYTWLRDGAAISGATGTSYTPVSGDIGSVIAVRVSFVDGKGHAESVVSAATAAVIA